MTNTLYALFIHYGTPFYMATNILKKYIKKVIFMIPKIRNLRDVLYLQGFLHNFIKKCFTKN